MCKRDLLKQEEGVGCFVSLPLSSLKKALVKESSFKIVKKLFFFSDLLKNSVFLCLIQNL